MITASGIGSGLDINSLVSQLVTAEGAPINLRLNRREAEFQAEVSAFGLLKSALAEFRSTQKGLAESGSFQSINSESSNPDLFTATGTADALLGSYSVQVNALAQSQKLVSKGFEDITTLLGSGTLTFAFGKYDGDENTFTPSTENAPKTVTIDASNNSLQGIRDAVNNATVGVTASIVDDGSGKRLVFSSGKSGVDNGLKITVSGDSVGDDLDDAGLSQLAFDPTVSAGSGKNITATVVAQDAELIVDGLTITRSENTVTGVIEGVTLELLKADNSLTESLTVSADDNAITEKVGDFVGSYNALRTTFTTLTARNEETGLRGELLGDSTLRSIDLQIRRILNNQVEGLNGSIRSMGDIGIKTLSDGTLELDSDTLNKAIAEDSKAVAALFAESDRTTDSLVKLTASSTSVKPGSYPIEITQVASQGTYTGASIGVFPLTIDTDNDSLSVKIDGVLSGEITLTQGSYTTGEELASHIKSQINSDITLIEAGVSVAVDYDGNQLKIISSRYGSASTVEVDSVDASTETTLGISVGVGDSGVDVAGTIGGVEATGSGRVLKASGDAQGLSVEIIGGGIGNRGAVSHGIGVSSRLADLMDTLLGSGNLIDFRIDSLNEKISGLEEQRVSLDRRITSLEERLRKQFIAMDALVGRLQTTSDFLTQQIKNLPGPIPKDRR